MFKTIIAASKISIIYYNCRLVFEHFLSVFIFFRLTLKMHSNRTFRRGHLSLWMISSVYQKQTVLLSKLFTAVSSGKFADLVEDNSFTAVLDRTSQHKCDEVNAKGKGVSNRNSNFSENTGDKLQPHSAKPDGCCTCTAEVYGNVSTSTFISSRRGSSFRQSQLSNMSRVTLCSKLVTSLLPHFSLDHHYPVPLTTKTQQTRGVWDIFKR